MERMHPRVQQPCRFIGTKESVYIRKELNSHRIGLVQQHARRFIVNTNMAVMIHHAAHAPFKTAECRKEQKETTELRDIEVNTSQSASTVQLAKT